MGNNDYYVGLDIGTNSIGWAVTDTNYNLQHIKRKLAWGVHLFENASTAARRRRYRANRRRLARRRKRILLLQSLFADTMATVDQNFFLKLNNSRYFPEDRDIKIKRDRFPLFNDKDFSEKDYFKKYPTIYHLQNALIEQSHKKFDLRLIYLAIHHLIKYRGHFALEHRNLNIADFSNEMVMDAFLTLSEYFEDRKIEHIFTSDNIAKYQLIVNEPQGILTIMRTFKDKFGKMEKVVEKALRIAIGGSGKVSDFFTDIEEEDDLKFSFKDNNFEEEKYSQINQVVGEDIVLIDSLKMLYDYMIVARLMEGETLFAKAMVRKFDTHKADLKELKKVVKEHLSNEDYFEIFKEYKQTKGENYPSYIGMLKMGKRKYSPAKGDYDTFTKFIKGKLKGVPDTDAIIDKIDRGVYMPLQTTKDNGKIPFQFNEYQLNIILQNQSKHYLFLSEKDENGLTMIDKILSILKFKIPYYVGPLVDKDKEFSWVVRKSYEPVKPWNFHEIIDGEQSAEKFIRRMTNKCTYLKLEDVLPRESLLYEEFVMLNLLNSVKINNEKIDTTLRQKIIDSIYKEGRTFTYKALETFIKRLNPTYDGPLSITGIDNDAKLGLPTRNKFNAIFKEKHIKDELIEKVIFYGTIFEDKKMYGQKVIELLKESKLSKHIINQVRQLNFTGWSRLSRAFLTGYSDFENRAVLTNESTGEVTSIIEIMRTNQQNLQEVLYDEKFNLQNALELYFLNIKEEQSLLDEVQSLPLSPSIKRPVYRALNMLMEIKELQGKKAPAKIMLETTRGRDEERRGKKTDSRLKQLQALYKVAKSDAKDLKELQDNLNLKLTDYDLKPRKMFLYYLQLGRCMYTGKQIDLDQLMTAAYDIDHIVPRSLVKDDSLDNLCLVVKSANTAKGMNYPLNSNVITKMLRFWQVLLDNKMMTKEKFARLTRRAELSDDEYKGFINRQLVEVSQANKAIGRLIKKYFPQTAVIYTRARQVSDFRQKFDLLKVREINKYHHAHDAYLNIVVGNYYSEHFQKKRFSKETAQYEFNAKNLFDVSFGTYWDKDKHLPIVLSIFKRKSILVTRQPFINKGEFYEQNLSKAGEVNRAPIKESGPISDVVKYGGYSGNNTSHFTLVEIETRPNKFERRLVPITIYDAIRISDDSVLLAHIKKILSKNEVKIIEKIIPLHTTLEINGSTQYLSGIDSLTQLIIQNSAEPFFELSTMKYFDLLQKANTIFVQNKHLITKDLLEFAVLPGKRNTDEGVISIKSNQKLYELIISQFAKPIYANVFAGDNVVANLVNSKDDFQNFPLEVQVQVLLDLIALLQTGPLKNVKLNDVGLKSTIHRNRISNLVKDNTLIVKSSLTGLKIKKQKISL